MVEKVHMWNYPIDAHNTYAARQQSKGQLTESLGAEIGSSDTTKIPLSTQITVADAQLSALNALFGTSQKKEPVYTEPPPDFLTRIFERGNPANRLFGSRTNLDQQMAALTQFAESLPPTLKDQAGTLSELINKAIKPGLEQVNSVLIQMARILQG